MNMTPLFTLDSLGDLRQIGILCGFSQGGQGKKRLYNYASKLKMVFPENFANVNDP